MKKKSTSNSKKVTVEFTIENVNGKKNINMEVHPRRVLLVEDEIICAVDLKFRLENMGCEVVGIASSGKEAIKAAEKHHPQIVFMDIQLKGCMTGIEAARIIQENSPVRFIFVTAYTDEFTREHIEDIAQSDVISKPVYDEALARAMRD